MGAVQGIVGGTNSVPMVKLSQGSSTLVLEPAMPSDPPDNLTPHRQVHAAGVGGVPLIHYKPWLRLRRPRAQSVLTTVVAIGAVLLFLLALVLAGPFHSERFISPSIRSKLLLLVVVLSALEVIYGFAMHRKNAAE